MNSKVTNYAELQAEKKRLENLVTFQKQQLRSEIEDIKTRIAQQLQPVTQAARTVKQISASPLQPNVIAQGTSAVVMAVTRKSFPRISFIMDLFFPSLVRNVAQNLTNQFIINLSNKRSSKPIRQL